MKVKAIAWDSIFLVTLIFLSILSTLVVFWKFILKEKTNASKFACVAKIQKYCADVVAGKNPDWNKIPPYQGCEKYGIIKPSEQQCEDVLR